MRSAPRWRSASQTVSGPVVSPACGRLRSPAARAASKCGLNCGLGTPTSGPPSPKADQPVGGMVQRVSRSCRRPPARRSRRGRRRPSGARCRKSPLGGDAGILDRLGVALDRDAHGDRGVGRTGQLGVPDLLHLGHFSGNLVGQQPHVLRGPDQVDHGEVDVDEVREVAEGEEVGQLLRVAGHLCRGAFGELGRRCAETLSRRGARAPRPWADGR